MLRPLGDRVIIKVAKEEETTVGGIVLTSSAKEKPQTGLVIAVGEGITLENGQKQALQVNVNDTVMFEKYAGTEVKNDGEEFLVVHEKDIIAIVK